METRTCRCSYCSELFTGTPVVENGKKYCTTICAKWDNNPEERPVVPIEGEGLAPALDFPPRAFDEY